MKRLFNNLNKKILIGASLQEVDLVIKSFARKEKAGIFDIEKATVLSLATSIVNGDPSFNEYKFIDNECAQVLFYSFLRSKIDHSSRTIYGLIPEESLSLPTSNEAYQTINKVRTGNVLSKNHKVEKLICDFEQFLDNKRILDEVLVLKSAITSFKDDDKELIKESISIDGNTLLYLLPSLNGELTYLENEFLEKLKSICDVQSPYISYTNETDKKVEVKKVTTYGYSNLVKYIIDEINDKKYNLGEVGIYTSSDAYNNLIRGYFENAGINCSFQNGEYAITEDYVGFFISVLDFLSSNFSIKYLYDIYRNPALRMYEDCDGKFHSYSAINKLKDLKSDKEQILFKVQKWSDGKKEFIEELLNIYDEDIATKELFDRTIEFTNKYTRNICHKYCKEALLSKANLFEYFDIENMSFKDKAEFIKSIISTIKISREVQTSKSYVVIDSMHSTYLPRKINFFIGLSSGEMTANGIDSPLISDDELTALLDKSGYIKLNKNTNDEFYANFKALQDTQLEGIQYFVTSVYDSSGLKELSNSAVYLEKEPGRGEDSSKYVHTVDFEVNVISSCGDYLYPQTEEYIDRVNDKNLSPSSIETIITCPLKYIYSRVYDDVQCDEVKDKWLKGGEEGTFAHAILEYYFKRILELKDTTLATFNKEEFDNCFECAFEEMKKNNPFSNADIQNNEASRIRGMVENYLERYYSNRDKYRPILFEENIYPESGVNFDLVPGYQVHGIIDRVDAYVDEDKTLHIRLVDYKTYGDTSYKNHKNNGIFPQAVVYPYLIKDYIKNNTPFITSVVGNYESVSDDVYLIYEMLKQNETYIPSYELVKDNVSNALNCYYELMKEPTWEHFNALYDLVFERESKFAKSTCEHCGYAKYCKFKIHKGDNTTWKKLE